MNLTVTSCHIDPPSLSIDEQHQALINIEGTLHIKTKNQELVEECFTIVDLAQQLKNWLPKMTPKFMFNAMDYDDEGLFVIEKMDCDKWVVTSNLGEKGIKETMLTKTLVSTCESYIDSVRVAVHKQLKLNLQEFGLF